jgi:ESF2/ABP1 family protein
MYVSITTIFPIPLQAAKLRLHLQPYAKIGRIYLTEEDASRYANRVKNGGCKKICYTEGWVEFFDKSEAKKVAEMLNARSMGGKKRHNFYHDDIWCMKYLSKFTWNDLMEHRVHQRQESKKKLEVALLKQKKQDEEFIESISKKNHMDSIERKRARKDGSTVSKRPRRERPVVHREAFKHKQDSAATMSTKESLLSALAL